MGWNVQLPMLGTQVSPVGEGPIAGQIETEVLLTFTPHLSPRSTDFRDSFSEDMSLVIRTLPSPVRDVKRGHLSSHTSQCSQPIATHWGFQFVRAGDRTDRAAGFGVGRRRPSVGGMDSDTGRHIARPLIYPYSLSNHSIASWSLIFRRR